MRKPRKRKACAATWLAIRIVYEIRHDARLILVHAMGHRSEIYKD